MSEKCRHKQTLPYSLDNLISALLEMRGYVQAKRFSGFQIDHQLELTGALDGKLAWLLALRMRSA